MTLEDLARLLRECQLSGRPETTVSGLAYNSRQVRPGDVFVCIQGFRADGLDYAHEAVQRGAVALVVDRMPSFPVGVPFLLVRDARKALAVLAAEFSGRPADGMLVLGVTGTNGKTTTTYLCDAVLRSKGYRPGLLGSIHARVGNQTRRLCNTTPESLDLHRLLAEMRMAGQDSVVMEVSSHALALDRVFGLPFDVAVFTNLTRDHLDFHYEMDAYFRAKLRLFQNLGTRPSRICPPFAILNLDDPYCPRILPALRVPFITYGLHPAAHVRAEDIAASPGGVSYRVVTPIGQRRVKLQLSGLFNVSNSLAAISTGLAQRLSLGEAVEAVESVSGVRGRFELVREGQDFTVVVDYAHTPDGLKSVLDSARQITSDRLIAVFGCGGDRDRAKRSMMGEVAGQTADVVIITSDNPRSESPASILADIRRGGLGTPAAWEAELDRGLAISRAIQMAGPGDTVLIAGKGHETYQILRDRTIEFDDAEVARQAIRLRSNRWGRRDSRAASSSIWTERRRAASSEFPAIKPRT
ncbi:MAG: UDP-N-acetylmuramoyl-L-alanyl-D-glutamate--2,6-diaminopimelate ligase [Candidatus Eremiobacterota bacterium]